MKRAYTRKTKVDNAHSVEMDALLLESPPVIEWVRRGLILIAATVNDPHAETRNWSQTHPIYVTPKQPAKPVKPEETPLLAAARTAI